MANVPDLSLEDVGYEFSPWVDNDRLLVLFNREVLADFVRVGEYRTLSHGLRDAVRRRHEHIGELKALGSCEDDVESVRFFEHMQLEDMEKGTRLLLMMKETQIKIDEKARFILKLRGDVVA
ncbi:hypothetical protein Tco_0506165 [Tanacetum coccineum]